MSFSFYKVLHVLGIMMLLMSWGGVLTFRVHQLTNSSFKRIFMMTHGVALAILFVTGFGLAKGSVQSSMPMWILVKIGIWIALAAGIIFARKFPKYASQMWVAVIGLGFCAAYMAIYKPI